MSIRLAQKYPAEIINADALQIYSHLDIATNKLPMDERSGIPHHLLGIKPWHAEYTVLDFVKDASKKVCIYDDLFIWRFLFILDK